MPSRRELLALIVLGAVPAFGQRNDKVWRIGYLAAGIRTPDGAPPEALRRALRGMGYVEGVNTVYEARFAEGDPGKLPAMVADLVRLKVDLIAVVGGPAAMAAKRATATLPIVIAFPSGDAVASGLIVSLAHPGGNVTGLTDESEQLNAKRMELLKEVLPNAARIGVVWNANDEGMTLRYREIEKAARLFRIEVQPLALRELRDFDAVFSSMARQRPDAIFVVSDSLTLIHRKSIIDHAMAQRIPTMYEGSRFVGEGGLMSYGPGAEESYGSAAVYIHRILSGMKPADLPAAQPMHYYLSINRKSADTLGVTFPQSVLLRADDVRE